MAEETFRNPDQYEKEETMEASASCSTKNFQNEVRQWFTAMSPEERSAVLGFEDGSLVVAALLSQIASPSSSTHDNKKANNDGIPDELRSITISKQQPAPTSLPLKRTTGELFSNGT